MYEDQPLHDRVNLTSNEGSTFWWLVMGAFPIHDREDINDIEDEFDALERGDF